MINVVGEALRVSCGGNWVTLSEAEAVACPAELVAVMVYMVVLVGAIGTEPLSGSALSSLGLGFGTIVIEVAFCVDQVSVASEPAMTVDGETLMVAVGVAGAGGGGGPCDGVGVG